MKNIALTMILASVLCLSAGAIADRSLESASGGQLTITFYNGNLRDVGLDVEGTSPSDFQHDVVVVDLTVDDELKFLATEGNFKRLENGQLGLQEGLTITAGGLRLSSSELVLIPRDSAQTSLQLSDEQGRDWFHLDYGHYEWDGNLLNARFLDVRIGVDLARHLGNPTLEGFLVGMGILESESNSPSGQKPVTGRGIEAACPVLDPNWPTMTGFDADIAMLEMDSVNQVARAGGRVALAPSAYFENIGNADVPWFAQFADTKNVDACCADQGDGVCAPYGNDQGGLLVYHLYRFVDKRLEQLGQSQVKHAFNSINTDSAAGSVACVAAGRPGRVVPAGCEDLYQVSSNANQFFLGPRDEIIAHTGVWLRDGSIWDLTGPEGEPDGNCDYFNPGLYGGQVPCEAPVADAMDRRLSVAESELTTPGARYFIESWYVVRDDVNIINSFGRKEITPTFTSAWTFPEAASFQQGPMINDYLSLQNPDTGSLADTLESEEGTVQLSSSVSEIAPGQWQYDFTLMNFDFDRAIDSFEIPVSPATSVSGLAFFDGDEDSVNDWVSSVGNSSITFEAPAEVKLKWGSLVSFRFLADKPPNMDTANLTVADEGDPDSLSIKVLTSSDVLAKDGFE